MRIMVDIGGYSVMGYDFEVGEAAYLKEPVKGYRYVEIVDYDGPRLVVRTTSGWEFTVWPDELEENN